jgi:hypothetical protein
MMQDSALAPAFSRDLACSRTPNNISKIFVHTIDFKRGRGMSKNNAQVAGYPHRQTTEEVGDVPSRRETLGAPG